MWECKTETLFTLFYLGNTIRKKFDDILNKYANEGWELDEFQCSDFGGCLKIFIFKREKK